MWKGNFGCTKVVKGAVFLLFGRKVEGRLSSIGIVLQCGESVMISGIKLKIVII